MSVLRESFKGERPFRFARNFERHVGLKLSHIVLVVALLVAMYLATENYSSDDGYGARQGATPAQPERATAES